MSKQDVLCFVPVLTEMANEPKMLEPLREGIGMKVYYMNLKGGLRYLSLIAILTTKRHNTKMKISIEA